ncbi:hypothetical protein [Streptomyces sp. NPDC048611]|uniref:hypothetical protein n=1 Tax=Streptomyces sp. NPDC048611 TaxID=3155635 RepID=UPI0034323EA0
MASMASDEARVARAEEVLRVYGLSEAGWRRSPGGNLQEVLRDLMQWCDATQHGFERALTAARAERAAEAAGGAGVAGDARASGDAGAAGIAEGAADGVGAGTA